MPEVSWPKAPEVITGIFIRNNEGKIALFQCPKWKGVWSMPGGHVEFNEKIETSLKRELFEEAGITVEDFKFVQVFEMINPPWFERPVHFIVLHYMCDYDGDFTLDYTELTGYKWFTIEEILTSTEVNDSMKESAGIINEMYKSVSRTKSA